MTACPVLTPGWTGMLLRCLVTSLLLCIVPMTGMAQSESARLRDLGVDPGLFAPGPNNAVTDVAGVQVGHRTLVEGDSVRTGVTAIRPHGGDLFREKVPAAVHVGNGFGKAAGFLQVQELGTIETPIVLTNTLDVGTAVDATVAWTLGRPGHGGRGVGQRRGWRNERRLPERYPGAARDAGRRGGRYRGRLGWRRGGG
jgi:L-aminopeptidase/D-esterase